MALVSAHTHIAAHRAWPSRDVPELVMGSILDPPQEAALLTITPKRAVRLETIPVVREKRSARLPGSDPEIDPDASDVEVTLADCKDVYDVLASDSACDALLHRPIVHEAPTDPEELKRRQQERAQRLLACLHVHPPDAGCPGEPHGEACPLGSMKLYDTLDELILGPWDRPLRNKLVCLARAGALLQGHKQGGWSFGRALERAATSTADPPPIIIQCAAGEADGLVTQR